MRLFIIGVHPKVAEQVNEPIVKVALRKTSAPTSSHSHLNHSTTVSNNEPTDGAAMDGSRHSNSVNGGGGGGAGVEATLSLASVSYALVDLHASYATEVFLQEIVCLSLLSSVFFDNRCLF